MTRHQAPQPPYPTELLADLHADNLPTEVAAQLWPRVRQDPDAMSVITALDAVQDRLHALGQDHNVATPIPDDVVARIEQALAGASAAGPAQQAAAGDGQVASLDAARARRTRRARFFLAGAAVTLAVVGGASFALWPKGATETADAPSAASAALDLGGSLQHGAVLAAMNNHVTSGPLTDKGALRACLRGADADRALLGAMNVVYRNKQAVLVLVAGGAPGKITALVLPADCGPDNPTPLSRAEF